MQKSKKLENLIEVLISVFFKKVGRSPLETRYLKTPIYKAKSYYTKLNRVLL